MDDIKQLLSGRELYTVEKGGTIKNTVNFMAEKSVGLVPVMDSGILRWLIISRVIPNRNNIPGTDTVFC